MGICSFCNSDKDLQEFTFKVKSNITIKFLKILPTPKKDQISIEFRQQDPNESDRGSVNLSKIHQNEKDSQFYQLSVKFKIVSQRKTFEDYFELRYQIDKFIKAQNQKIEQNMISKLTITIRFDHNFLSGENDVLPHEDPKLKLLESVLNQFRAFQPMKNCNFEIQVVMDRNKNKDQIKKMCKEIQNNQLQTTEMMRLRQQRQEREKKEQQRKNEQNLRKADQQKLLKVKDGKPAQNNEGNRKSPKNPEQKSNPKFVLVAVYNLNIG